MKKERVPQPAPLPLTETIFNYIGWSSLVFYGLYEIFSFTKGKTLRIFFWKHWNNIHVLRMNDSCDVKTTENPTPNMFCFITLGLGPNLTTLYNPVRITRWCRRYQRNGGTPQKCSPRHYRPGANAHTIIQKRTTTSSLEWSFPLLGHQTLMY